MIPIVKVMKTVPGSTDVNGTYQDISIYVRSIEVTMTLNHPAVASISLLNQSYDFPSTNSPFSIGGSCEFTAGCWVKVWILPPGETPGWDNILFLGQVGDVTFHPGVFKNDLTVIAYAPLESLKHQPVPCHLDAMYNQPYTLRNIIVGGTRTFGLPANAQGCYIDGLMWEASSTLGIYCADSMGGSPTVSNDLSNFTLLNYRPGKTTSLFSALSALAERFDLILDVAYNSATSRLNLVVRRAKTIADSADNTIYSQAVFESTLKLANQYRVDGVIVYGNRDRSVVAACGDIRSQRVQVYDDDSILSYEEAYALARSKYLIAQEGCWEGSIKFDPLWNYSLYSMWTVRPGEIIWWTDSVNGINRKFRVHQVRHAYNANNINTPRWTITVEPVPGSYRVDKILGKIVVEMDRRISGDATACIHTMQDTKELYESGTIYRNGTPASNYTDGTVVATW